MSPIESDLARSLKAVNIRVVANMEGRDTIGIEVPNLTGGTAKMLANHHLTKPVLIGEIQEDGQFEVVWETEGLVDGDAWSDFLPGSKDIIADWTAPIKCGNYNTVTKTCSGQNM